MAYRKIVSSDPRYLAATDILIGDMSDINYEFMLFDRPLILLANRWVRENVPDMGVKADLPSLEEAIRRSLLYPQEYAEQRKYWLNRTMHQPDGNSSKRVIEKVVELSGMHEPNFLLLHGGDDVLRTHLDPIYDVLTKQERAVEYREYGTITEKQRGNKLIVISAHNGLLKMVPFGYKVHIDHGVKGIGVTDFGAQLLQYKDNDYFPATDLHVTEGRVSFEKTSELLGPNRARAVMVGYPKSDVLIELNVPETRKNVCRELGIENSKPLVTYAPAGKYRYPSKQGATLSREVLTFLKKLGKKSNYNVLVKLKTPPKWYPRKVVRRVRRGLLQH